MLHRALAQFRLLEQGRDSQPNHMLGEAVGINCILLVTMGADSCLFLEYGSFMHPPPVFALSPTPLWLLCMYVWFKHPGITHLLAKRALPCLVFVKCYIGARPLVLEHWHCSVLLIPEATHSSFCKQGG